MAVHHHQWTHSASATTSSSDRLLWWQRLVLTDKMRAFLFLWIFVLLMLHVAGGGQRDDPAPGAGIVMTCPKLCQCEAGTVDCSNRGLTQVPLDLPKEADKM